MLKAINLLALTFLVSMAFSQNVLNESWFITRDGALNDDDFAWGVEVDNNNQIYWSTSEKTSGFNEKDIFVYKLNVNGNEVWSSPYYFGGDYEQQAYNSVLYNGILYVGGRTWTGYFGLDYSNALLFALDTASQDTLWTFIWDNNAKYEEVDGIAIDTSGIYISGWTHDIVSNMDAFIIKLNFAGDTVWVTQWGSGNYDSCDGHCIIDDSTIYISGLYNINSSQAYLAAFDKTTGNYKWDKQWGGNGLEDGLGLISDGKYIYQCGTTSSHADSSMFIIKYDKNGNEIWETLTNKAFKGRSMAMANDGTLYLAATSNTLGAGGEDLIIMQYDTLNGNLIEYKTWGGINDESVQDIRIKDDFMYLTGRTISYSSNTKNDAFLIKAPLFIPNSINEESLNNKFIVSPNPFLDVLNITSKEKSTLTIYSANGQLISQQNLMIGNQKIITSGWPAGIYFGICDNSERIKLIKN